MIPNWFTNFSMHIMDKCRWFGSTISLQLLDLFKYYGVEINFHVSKTNYRIEDGEDNSQIFFIEVSLRQGKESKSHIRSKIGVLQKYKVRP